jgi:hypothetical protein
MTTAEALAIAATVMPLRRPSLDKLGSATAGQISAGTEALSKRFDGIAVTCADMQKEIDRARAGVALFTSGPTQ